MPEQSRMDSKTALRLFFRLSRPFFLVGVVILYALGAGIAHYLGGHIDWSAYLFGQLWVSLLQLSVHYLNEYFNAPADAQNPNRTWLTGGSGALGEGKLPRRAALLAAYTSLAILASLTVIMASRGYLSPTVVLIMAIAFFGALSYSTPPLNLEASGYGELLTSVLVAFLVPAFAFLLQSEALHRLVAMSAFPLATLHLAMLMAFELPDYPTDLKYGKRTLLVRMGWRNGMLFHDILILGSFFLLLFAALFGYPRFAFWSGFIVFPLGLFQIFQMRRIAMGGKPNWPLLTTGAVSLFGCMAYLLTFSFWIN